MFKNGKFFLPPPRDGKDIKQLFAYAVEKGIGQPVDEQGLPQGHWTPDTLADAISIIDHPKASANIRSVQYWFDPKNNRNISPNYCRWLARIFGCGDPDAISEWQTALLAARRLFIDTRGEPSSSKSGSVRKGGDFVTVYTPPELRYAAASDIGYCSAVEAPQSPTVHLKSRFAGRLETLFSDPIILSAVVWFWLTGILFLAAMLGVLSVSYMTPDGTDKEVGYLWSPSWIIHDLVLLPVFLMVVSTAINFWKNEARAVFLNDQSKRLAQVGWLQKVNSLSILYWVALAISVCFVFFVQWVGAYVVPIVNNEMGNAAVSWVNIILARPDIMSVIGALVLSGIYFAFAAMVFFFLNVGFAFLYTVWSDYSDLYRNAKVSAAEQDDARMRLVGIKLVEHIFFGTVLALWISTSIKLYSMYISVNSEDILAWLYTDFRQLLDSSDIHENITVGYSLSQFSTIIFTSVIAGVFLYVYFNARTLCLRKDHVFDSAPWGRWLSVIILLLINFLSVGQMDGFSLLLLLSILATAYCVYARRGTARRLDHSIFGTSATEL